jgi:uroporphyrinogen decarboxylase
MNSRDRVFAAIHHTQPDRVPLNIWLYQPRFGSEQLKTEIQAKYGDLDGFYDAFGIDLRMEILPLPYRDLIPGPDGTMNTGEGGLPIGEITNTSFRDPDDDSLYMGLQNLINKYGRDKVIVAHVWGAVEGAFSFMGVAATLTAMAAEPGRTDDLFSRICDWSVRVTRHAMSLGADIIQISADAGSMNRMLFSPTLWRRLVYPNDKRIVDAVKEHGKIAAMHNDGYIMPILDDLVTMGIEILHPLQISAGMNLVQVKQQYGDRLTIHGGLYLARLLPDAPEQVLVDSIRSVMESLKPNGGFIFNTEHFVPETVDLSRLELAYQTALRSASY